MVKCLCVHRQIHSFMLVSLNLSSPLLAINKVLTLNRSDVESSTYRNESVLSFHGGGYRVWMFTLKGRCG